MLFIFYTIDNFKLFIKKNSSVNNNILNVF